MSKINYWPTFSLLGVLVVMGGLFVYFSILHNERLEVALSEEDKAYLKVHATNTLATDIITDDQNLIEDESELEDWRKIYPKTTSIKIGDTPVFASMAKTWPERIQGLSETPFLPDFVVKVFVFDTVDFHPIWMKDMNYSIDIIWVDLENMVVDFVENAPVDSYPESFASEVPAKYVIETTAGFVEKNKIKIGDKVTMSSEMENPISLQ